MILLPLKEQCSGCGACVQACKKNAISMKEDKEGFIYPIIDYENCIECGLCLNMCKKLNVNTSYPAAAYAAYSQNNELRKKSSSGGIFSELAAIVLKDGGVVFGAAFDNDFLVHHIFIDDVEKLNLLRGSKYVQSNIGSAYIDAEKFLKSGKKVLFSGTACQIAGLKTYLKKDYDNLITIDVLCHGVPSLKLWKKYLSEQKNSYKADIKEVFFRCKDTGWKNYSVLIEFENGNVYSKSHKDDLFMKLFLSDVALRPSCYECKYKSFPRISDITIGDAWGVESEYPQMVDDLGTSIVILNSSKGQLLLNNIDNIKLCEVEIDKILGKKNPAVNSIKPHKKRRKFFKMIDNSSIAELSKLVKLSMYVKIKKKLKKVIRK